MNNFAQKIGDLSCEITPGQVVTLPVFIGIFKHATRKDLIDILQRPGVSRRYVHECLCIAPWQVLKEFPNQILLQELGAANLPLSRRRALEFLFQ